MSFRLYIYYCALCGACTAFAGWALGRAWATGSAMSQAGLKGLFLGVALALGLGLVDALWNFSTRQVVAIGVRVLAAGLVGAVGGLVGGWVGQLFYGWRELFVFLVLGWTFTGLLIGLSPSAFDYLVGTARGARRKVRNGILGGALGGVLGGILFLQLKAFWAGVFGVGNSSTGSAEDLWSPSALGFVALGLCIGLLTGLAQVILKEAWVRVEAGFRPGRELLLTKDETTIGRAETCDIGLFGDPSTEHLHARILHRDGGYLLADAGAPGGTYLNGTRVGPPAPLRSGDLIGVGRNSLRFGERRKRA